jgi:hypothetical protein
MNSSGSRRKSLGQVLSIAFFSLCFFSGDSDIAHGQQFPISMRVRASSTVTGAKVTIDDIALVESSDQKEDGKAVSVKKVILLDSLEPGGERHRPQEGHPQLYGGKVDGARGRLPRGPSQLANPPGLAASGGDSEPGPNRLAGAGRTSGDESC